MLLDVVFTQSSSTFPAEKLPHWAILQSTSIEHPSISGVTCLQVCSPPIPLRKPLLQAHANLCWRRTIKIWFLLKKIRFNERQAGQQQMVRLIGSTKIDGVFERLQMKCLSARSGVKLSTSWNRGSGVWGVALALWPSPSDSFLLEGRSLSTCCHQILHRPRCWSMSNKNSRKAKFLWERTHRTYLHVHLPPFPQIKHRS